MSVFNNVENFPQDEHKNIKFPLTKIVQKYFSIDAVSGANFFRTDIGVGDARANDFVIKNKT